MNASNAPAVSIFLPTYNHARFLPQAIESIFAQESTDWELIIVDYDSTDETQELLPKKMSDILQPFRLIRQVSFIFWKTYCVAVLKRSMRA